MMSKRAKIYEADGAKKIIGNKLKDRRLNQDFSISDIADMTDFSKSTIINMEKGTATNLDYYIGYAKTLDYKLNELFDIPVNYSPKYDLSDDKKNRIFLSKKIRILLIEHDFFNNNVTVEDIINYFKKTNQMVRTSKLSTDVSRILLNWVEDGLLIISNKKGRNNVYRKKNLSD